MQGSIIKTIKKGDTTYRLLDYIQSTGTQYINTNIVPTTNTKIEIDIKTLSTIGNWDIICMARDYQMSRDGSTNQFAFYLGGSKTSLGTYSTNTRYAITFDGKNSKAIINGTTYNLTKGSTQPIEKLLLFSQGGTGGFISAQTFSAKIYDNDVLKLDLIPCERITDNVLGLLDLVSGSFLTNQGTGTFTKGNYIKVEHIYKPTFIENGVEYEELIYIESTGTQSIKLGNSIPFNTDNTVLECDFQFTEIATTSSAKWLFSNQTSSSNILDFYSQVNADHNGFYIRPSTSQSGVGTIVPHDTNKHHMKADFINKKLYFDDDVYTMTYNQSSQTAPMYLFRRANQDTGYAKVKLFNFKYTRMVHHDYDFDLIPAKRVSDGVIGLFNKINKSFLTNAGSGTFVSGNRVEVKKITQCLIDNNVMYYPLDYLQTDGNQKITTNIKVNVNSEIFTNIDVLGQGVGTINPVYVGGNDASFYCWASGGANYRFGGLPISYTATATGHKTITHNKDGIWYDNYPNVKTNKIGSYSGTYTFDNISLDLFYAQITATDRRGAKVKFYEFIVREGNIETAHLIPVEKTDGTKGLLDVVSHTFYGNSGSGSFSGNKREIILVE